MQKTSGLWLKIGHWWRRTLRAHWPELYISHRAFLNEEAKRHYAEDACRALQRRLDALREEVNTGSDKLSQGMTTLEAEYRRLLAEKDSGWSARVAKLETENQHLQLLASHDLPTGLYNKGWFEESFQKVLVPELKRALFARQGERAPTITALMLDLDRFKVLNDTMGHQAGDDALRVVAELLKKFFHRHHRPTDMICRWGGDEFLVILPEAKVGYVQQWAQQFLEAMRSDIRLRMIEHNVGVTASIGIARVTIDLQSASEDVLIDLIGTVDGAAQQAKRAGGNRIQLAEDVTYWSGLDK